MGAMAALLDDLLYLAGVSATDVLEPLDDMSNVEVLYTIQELKSLVMARLMEEEDKR